MENQCIIGYLKGLKISPNGAKVMHMPTQFMFTFLNFCEYIHKHIFFTEFEININSQGIKGYTYPNPMLLNVVR